MELELHYVNKIKEAKIKLNGLTVIAGANSSGKSTVGRTLYTVVKSIANTKRVDNNMNRQFMQKHIESFYSRLSGLKVVNKAEMFQDMPHSPLQFISQLESAKDKRNYLSEIRKQISSAKGIVPRQKKLLEDDLNNLEICIENKDNPAAGLKTELQYLIESEFLNSFCSSTIESANTSVGLKLEGVQGIFFSTKDRVVNKVESSEKEFFSFIDDVTYIESPLYIHLADAIIRAQTWRETEGQHSILYRPMIPSHIKDMVEKIVGAARYSDNKGVGASLNMNDITGGQLTYDSSTYQLVYKEGDYSYKTINVASGVKSLSIVQLLEDAKIIGPNSILIWDEPENHLHPEWQIEFAKKMVDLAMNGVPILVTTHSPYFLQALRTYSISGEMEDYVNFYTPVEDDNHLETIVDVTDDLTSVFATLAEPMNKIMDIN